MHGNQQPGDAQIQLGQVAGLTHEHFRQRIHRFDFAQLAALELGDLENIEQPLAAH
ncbi:hypothetical protein D3C78_1826840 [compost metagenome]